MDNYLMAYLQDSYSMTINYEAGQIITFYEKRRDESEGIYDIFPPMMFCKAASDCGRRYICHANSFQRRGITADHVFGVWLLENSVQLNVHFNRQFEQIIECLCEEDAKDVIQEMETIRKQLLNFSEHHGVNINNMPQLSLNDFWSEKDEECPF